MTVLIRSQSERNTTAAKLYKVCAQMAAGEPVNIACYGDSTTDGNYTTDDALNPVDGDGNAIGETNHTAASPNAWPAKLQVLLREMFGNLNLNINIWNAGYSGKRIDNGWALENYDAAVTDNPFYGVPDITFIQFGLNDLGIAGSQIEDHTTQTRLLCQKLIAAGTVPVLLTCDAFWLVTPNIRDHKEGSRQIDEAKKALAAELDIPIFDIGMAERDWLERNGGQYRWAIEQPDGLHFGDSGHAFKAGYLAKELFRDTFVFTGTQQQMQSMDSRMNRTTTASSNTEATNVLQGATMYQAVVPGEELFKVWVWNESPHCELIYRAINGDGYDDVSNAVLPKIRIVERIKGTVKDQTPATIGPQDTTYSLSEMPVLCGQLPYGLCSISYLSGSDTSASSFYGAVELAPWPASVRKASDCLANIGEYSTAVDTGTGVTLIPEQSDGSNVFGLMREEYVDLYIDATLAPRTGVVLAHANDWGPGAVEGTIRAFGSKGFMYIFRGLLANYIGRGFVQPDGTIVFNTMGTVTNLDLTQRCELRVRLQRSGNNKIVKVFPSWSLGATGNEFSFGPAEKVIPLAGACGGLFHYAEGAEVIRQSIIHKMFKRVGNIADELVGVQPMEGSAPVREIAGSAVAVTVAGTLAETTVSTIHLPPLSKNAALLVNLYFTSFPTTVGSKTFRVKLNGVVIWTGSIASGTALDNLSTQLCMRNRGTSNSQFTSNGSAIATSVDTTVSNVDTSVGAVLTITTQLASVADQATLEAYSVLALTA